MPVVGVKAVLTEIAVINCRLTCSVLQQNSIVYNGESRLDVLSDGLSILLKMSAL